MTTGEKIKQRRISLGMTQEELAFKCGYKSRTSINKIELSQDVSLKNLKKVAEALNTDPENLISWTEPETIGFALGELAHDKELVDLALKIHNAPLTTRETIFKIVNALLP